MKINGFMKGYQFLSIIALSLLAFSCNKNEIAEPSAIATETSSSSNITSVDPSRDNLIVEEIFDNLISGVYAPKGEVVRYGNNFKFQVYRDYSFSVVQPVQKTYARFEMRKEDSPEGVVRAEAARNTKETSRHLRYGLNIYFPSESWQKSDDWEIITQFWSQPDNLTENKLNRNPPIELFVDNDSLFIGVKWDSTKYQTSINRSNKIIYKLGPIKRDSWVNFVYNIKYSYLSDGILEVWKDGVKVVNHRGPNCYNDTDIPYFKFGIYKRYWTNALTEKRVIHVDDARIGNTLATYNDIAPRQLSSEPAMAL